MEFSQKVQLAPLTSFGLPATASRLCRVREKSEIAEALLFANRHGMELLPLGAGSNLVLTQDYPGLVIKMEMSGIEKVDEESGMVLVRMQGGQDWSSAVEYCLDQGWYGLENLAMIPGSAGAAPVQNIGAYGVEISDRLVDVEASDTSSGTEKKFSAEQCSFGYRTSRFKRSKDRWIITSITLRLHRSPWVDTSYKALALELQNMKVKHPTPQDVYKAVCSIRKAKLPDPSEFGNVGSFFTNPVLDLDKFRKLKEQYDDIPSFDAGDGRVKLAAAWLIDKCGLKGYEQGQVGVHSKQALVLINKGQATGKQVLAIADKVRQSVEETFGISLEFEPRIV